MADSPCDFVWFTPEHYPACLDLIQRLTPEEMAQRDQVFGLHEWENVPIPEDQTGKNTQTGNCICRDAFGFSYYFHPGQTKDGLIAMADKIILKVLAPGLVVGNVIHRIFDEEEFQKKAAAHKKISDEMVAKNNAQQQGVEEDRLARAQIFHHRFLVTAAHFAGIKNPSKISGDELADIHAGAVLMDKEIPSHEIWMNHFVPMPPKRETLKDWHEYVASAKSALITRKEITRNADGQIVSVN